VTKLTSTYLVGEGILIDPIAPPQGLGWFDGREIGFVLSAGIRPHAISATRLRPSLLLAHGPPVVGDGRERLMAFAAAA
jgi:hypothetical protein